MKLSDKSKALFKSIVNFLLQILVIVITSALLIAIMLKSTLLNKNYILEKLDEVEYYDNVYNSVISGFENYILQSGFDSAILDNVITKENVYNHTNYILDNIYEGAKVTLNFDDIHGKFETNIENYISSKGLVITDKASIDKYINTLIKEYEKNILNNKYIQNISNIVSKLNIYLEKIIIISAIVLVIIITLIAAVNIKSYKRILSIIGISMLSSGFLYMTAEIILKIYINSQKLTLFTSAFSLVLRSVYRDILLYILVCSISFIVLGIVLIILSNFLKFIKKNKTP